MANGFTEFPKFPVQFTEQDQARIDTLAEQKKEMERIYFAHFAPQAWAAKPFISRAVRGIAAEAIPQPSWLRDITPWLEKGFTPEQFDVFRGEVESEFQELQRLQLVSERVSKIKDHLALLALMDKLTGSKEQLYELIPELDDPDLLPLRDLERKWIEDFYQHISSASREDVEAYYEGRELTDAELRENIALLTDKGILSPSQVLSTVAFSKDIGEIASALQMAHPPTTIDGEATFESIKASDLWDEMERLGLVPSRDMEKVEEDVKALEAHYKSQDEELGSYTSLTDTETGETLLVRVKDDNTVWYEERLVGRFNPDEGKFNPLTPDEWYVIQVTEDRELYPQRAAEAMNKLIAAGEGELYERALAMYKQHKITMNSLAPEATDSTWSNFEAGIGNMIGAMGGALKWAGAEGIGDNFSNFGDYLARKALPGVPLRGEEGLQVGGFLRTTGVRTLGFLLALIPAAILGAHVGVGVAGVLGLGKIGTLILGAIGAAGASRPIESVMEAGGTYEQALDMGMTEAEASDAFTSVFWNNMKLTGMDAFQFGLAFAPLPAKIGGRVIARGLVRTVMIGGKVVVVGGTEALEEYLQERWTRMALGQEIVWDAEMEEAVVLGGFFGLTLGGAGEVYTRIQGRTLNNVSEESRAKYELTKEQAIKEGKDENLANLEALEELVSTPEGKEAFTAAVEDVIQEDNIRRIKDPEVADAVRNELAREQTLPAQTLTELREQKREMRSLNTEIGLNSRTLEILKAQIEEGKSVSTVKEIAVLDKQIEAVGKDIEIAKQKVEEHETRLARSEIIGKTKAELELQAEMVEVAKKEMSNLEAKREGLTNEKESIGKVTPKDEAAVVELTKKIKDMEAQRKGVNTKIKELKATEAPTIELPIRMINKKVWNSLVIPARAIAAKAAGLEGKVGSKSWESLTDAEKKAIGSQPKIKVEIVTSRVVLPQGEKFEATVFRSEREEGKAPTDEGLVGKATYYTTSREYAETYDGAEAYKVSLRNALVIATEADWETFSYRTRELRDQALEQGKSEDWVQATLREQLESEGYDGVVIGKGIVEVGEQVAVFYPEQVVKSVDAKTEIVAETPITPVFLGEINIGATKIIKAFKALGRDIDASWVKANPEEAWAELIEDVAGDASVTQAHLARIWELAGIKEVAPSPEVTPEVTKPTKAEVGVTPEAAKTISELESLGKRLIQAKEIGDTDAITDLEGRIRSLGEIPILREDIASKEGQRRAELSDEKWIKELAANIGDTLTLGEVNDLLELRLAGWKALGAESQHKALLKRVVMFRSQYVEVKPPEVARAALEAVEENRALTIDPAKADAQAENMIGFSEQKIDPTKIDVKNIRRLNEEVDARLFEPDFTNPLDIAASTAMYTGDAHAYAEALPPDFKENVSQEFKDAKFADVSYWNLMRMDTIRAFSFIDEGNFGGIARQKILRPTERLHMAKIRKFEQYTSWFMDLERRFNMDSWKYRRLFGTKEGQNVMASVIEKIEDFPDAAIKTVDEHLQRGDVQEIVGKYPIPVQEDMVGFAQGVRILFDSVRAETNVVRVKMGKEAIPYLKNYLPWIYETNIWGKFFGMKVKPDFLLETAPPPDYIKPSEPFNPRALEREGGLKNYHKVRDIRKLFLDYADVMTQDMFYTPIVQNAKAHAAVMMDKAPSASQWVVDWAVESYAGVPGSFSRVLRRMLPPPVRHGLLAVRRRLTRAVFPLNWTWNLIVQPSSIALTTLQYGTGNTVRAAWDCLTNKEIRDFIHQHMFSFIIKQRLEGSILYQDIGTTIERQHALSRSKLDTAVHYANWLTRTIEQGVTTLSIQAAYLEGKKRGYTGRQLIDYASEGGAKTQSMYNPQNVPGILRSPEVGAIVPFQTFAFEALNSMSEMSGIKHLRAGAWHTAALDSKTGQELRKKRLMHFGEFLVAIYILNLIGELAINRKPWQPSSFIPFASLMMSGIEPNKTWNYPLPVRYVSEFYRGMRAFFEYGNWEEITKWVISYHSPGGVQIARTLEGTIAVIEGRVTDVSGEKVLYVIGDDPLEWIKAITMGVYQTEAGQQWAEQQFEGVEPTANEYLKDLQGLGDLLGKIVEEDTFLPSGDRVPEGRYLLTDFASDLEAMLVDWEKKRGNLIEEESMEWSGLPETLITDESSPFPDLAKFYIYSKKLLDEYYDVPSKDRLDYRKANPGVDAVLFFWYKTSTVRSKKAQDIVIDLFNWYGIDKNPYMHPANLPEVPEELKLVPE